MQQIEFRLPNALVSVTPAGARLWEIDALRGVAVVLMVFYHFMWDLYYFNIAAVNVFAEPWQLFARSIGTLFLLILGVSVTLRAARMHASPAASAGRRFWRDSLIRAGVLYGLGMLITLGTYLFIGDAYVRFGILHLLGLSMILATPFVYVAPWVSLLVGALAMGLGVYLNTLVISSPWLVWLGVLQAGITMVDYYPLLPWLGIALWGVALGLWIYPQGQRRFPLPDWSSFVPVTSLRWVGRHSLIIYMLHQPVLMGLLYALGLM